MKYLKKIYIYKLKETFVYQTNILGYDKSIFDKNNKLMVSISRSGILTIFKDYTWNGCSPKFSFFGAVIGTPEGEIGDNGYPKTYYASLVHDALYQLSEFIFKRNERSKVDKIFYDLLKADDFKLAKLYYYMVRIVGGIYWRN